MFSSASGVRAGMGFPHPLGARGWGVSPALCFGQGQCFPRCLQSSTETWMEPLLRAGHCSVLHMPPPSTTFRAPPPEHADTSGCPSSVARLSDGPTVRLNGPPASCPPQSSPLAAGDLLVLAVIPPGSFPNQCPPLHPSIPRPAPFGLWLLRSDRVPGLGQVVGKQRQQDSSGLSSTGKEQGDKAVIFRQ